MTSNQHGPYVRGYTRVTQQRGVRVVLLTPTPDLSENILADQGRLFAQAEMIRRLAAERGGDPSAFGPP